jgi:hypothetical protein
MDFVNIIPAIQSWAPLIILNPLICSQGLFGVSFLFILRFLGQLIALFAVSALIGKLLRLDKTYDNLHHSGNG